MAYAIPRPQAPKGAPPSYGKQPDGYFQYVNVPGHKEYEFGWNRGHPNHYISRYEQSKDHRFRTRVSSFPAHCRNLKNCFPLRFFVKAILADKTAQFDNLKGSEFQFSKIKIQIH